MSGTNSCASSSSSTRRIRFFSMLESVIFFVYLDKYKSRVSVPADVNAETSFCRSAGAPFERDEISILNEQSSAARPRRRKYSNIQTIRHYRGAITAPKRAGPLN